MAIKPDGDTGHEAKPDADLARVLRVAGGRDRPPEDFLREARAALHSEWSSMVSARHSKQRRWVRFAAAASVAIVAAGIWLARDSAVGAGQRVASVDRSVGSVRADRGWLAIARDVHRGAPLNAGDELATGPDGGAAIQLSGGAIVRLDSGTRVTVVDAQRLTLSAGAAYVDATPHGVAAAPMLSIDTPLGAVRHLGTQYEVRVVQENLRVTVREGRVELTGLDGVARTGESGERLTLHADGGLERVRIARDAPDWQWANTLAVPFSIENRPLSEFLAWAARELGREIRYATPQSEAEARRTILRGSVSDLAPQAAFAAVLSTTRLHDETRGHRITISVDDR